MPDPGSFISMDGGRNRDGRNDDSCRWHFLADDGSVFDAALFLHASCHICARCDFEGAILAGKRMPGGDCSNASSDDALWSSLLRSRITTEQVSKVASIFRNGELPVLVVCIHCCLCVGAVCRAGAASAGYFRLPC